MKKGKSYKIGFVQTELVAKRWQPAKVRSIWSWTIVFRRFAPKHRKIKLLDKARKAKVHLYLGRKWMNSLKFRPTPVVGQSVVDKTSRFQSKTIFLNLNHGLIISITTSCVTASKWCPKMSITMLRVLRGNQEVKKMTLTAINSKFVRRLRASFRASLNNNKR